MIYDNTEIPLYLLSESKRRQEFLKKIGINFTVISPYGEDKPFQFKSPRYYVKQKALNKMQETLKMYYSLNGAFISADTVVVRKKKILEKPASIEEAVKTLKLLEGKWHTILTAYCICLPKKNIEILKCVRTEVKLKALKQKEIEHYVRTGEPFDKAGAYAIQGYGSFMIEKIKGSFTNVIDFPLTELIEDLLHLKIIKIRD